jgi:CLIP-associating protein 1/2
METLFHPKNYMSLLDEGSQIDPIKIDNEADLRKAFESIEESLADTQWNERLVALGKLQGLVHGDGLHFESFQGYLRHCQELVANQLTDLRSTLIKEACRTVAVLALKMGTGFSAFVDALFTPMMKLSAVKTSVISSAGDRAIRIVIATTRTSENSRLFAVVADHCACKSPHLRYNAYEYACIIGAVWDPGFLEKNVQSFRNLIRVGVADADPSARRAARNLFWVLHSRTSALQIHFDKILSELEPLAQKHLASEMQSPSKGLIEMLNVMRQCDEDAEAFYYLASEATVVGMAPPSAADTNRCSPIISKRTPCTSRTRSFSPDMHEAEVSPRPSPRPSVCTHSISPPAGPIDTESSSQLVHDSQTAAQQRYSRRMSIAGPVRVAQRSTCRQVRPGEKEAGGACRMSAGAVSEGNRPLPAMQRHAGIIEGPKRVAMAPAKPRSEDSSSHRMLRTTGPARVAVSITHMKAEEEVESHGRMEASRRMSHAPKSKHALQKSSSDCAEKPALSLDDIRNLINETLWSKKLHALETMTVMLRRSAEAQDTTSDGADTRLRAAIVEIFVDLSNAHLGDPHHKVASEAFNVLKQCVDLYSAMCIPKIGIFVPNLFHRLADRRASIKEAANDLLDLTRTAFDSAALLTALSPKITEIPDRTKTALMQYLGAIVPHSGTYFANPQSSWAFLGRMAAILGGVGPKPSSTLLITGRKLLEEVYRTAPEVTCSQIASLPLQRQSVLNRLLSHCAPNIEELVAAAAKGDWNSHATSRVQPKTHSGKENSRPNGSENRLGSLSRNTMVSAGLDKKTPLESRQPAEPPVNAGSDSVHDIAWLLHSLQMKKVGLPGVIEAIRELKVVIKSGDDIFWDDHCVEIVRALLETMHHEFSPSMMHNGDENNTKGDLCTPIKLVPQTGLSPQVENGRLSSKLQHLHLACQALLLIVRDRGSHLKVNTCLR